MQYGFAADTIKKVTMRTAANNQVSYTNAANPDELFPLGNSNDIRVRVL
jgi:hypothetical protein